MTSRSTVTWHLAVFGRQMTAAVCDLMFKLLRGLCCALHVIRLPLKHSFDNAAVLLNHTHPRHDHH